MTVSAVPATLPDYDRNDWKQWTDADRDCQDARNEVLIAESRTKVAYRTDRKCRVAAGEWLAPYTNTIVTDPGRLDVDHMVPLGNAHDSGAWQWSANRRERYANYLDDPQHLIAVTASANRSKGARGPDQWKPEDQTYWCQYAVDWIAIKSTWDLTVTEAGTWLASMVQMLYSCANRPASDGFARQCPWRTPTPRARPAISVQQTRNSNGPSGRTTPATRHRRLEKPVYRGAKAMAEASPSGWCPVPGTEMATASYAKDDRCRIELLLPLRLRTEGDHAMNVP